MYISGHVQPNFHADGVKSHLESSRKWQLNWTLDDTPFYGVRSALENHRIPGRVHKPHYDCPLKANAMDTYRYVDAEWRRTVLAECKTSSVLDIWGLTERLVKVRKDLCVVIR